MATIKNLVLEQGATFSANIQYLNSNKVPIPLVGYNVRSKMRTSYNAANAAAFVAVITNAATGNITLSLTASETAALEYGRYVYDVEAYSGQVLVRVVEGTIDVTPGVSGMDLGSLLSGNVSTSDLIEGNNLYYTNARVQSALLNVDGNILPSVSNTYNLGSPTQRWKSLFLEDKTIFLGNVAISLDDITNKLTFIDTANAAATISLQIGTGANSVTLDAQNGSLSTSLSPNSVTASMIAPGAISPDKIGGFNTANVPEFTNLYFTNARAIAAFTAGTNITIDVNGVISSSGGGGGPGGTGSVTQANLTTSNVIELGSNLYYSNTRVYSNVITILSSYATLSNLNLKANLTQLTTANVAESTSNLYYTNARVRSTLSGGTGVSYDTTTGTISIGQNVSPNATVTFANLNVTGITNFYGNVTTFSSNNLSISDNMIYLNSSSTASNPDLGFAANYNDGSYKHTGFFRDATDGVWKLFDSYTPEPDANIFIDTNHASFRLANLAATTVTANLIGNVTGYVSSIGNFTTSNLAEGNNSYYTNARVYANVIGLLNLKANVIDLTTANIIESANSLYYTNARVRSAFSAGANITIDANGVISSTGGSGGGGTGTVTGANLTTSNVVELGSNLYYSNTRVYSNVIGLFTNYATVANLSLRANVGDLSTANVSESASNLYYTNARVYANVILILNTKANLTQLTTANVAESTSNLYYTNARVYSNVIGLFANYATVANLNLRANIADLTTANVIEAGSNIYYTNARVYSNVISLLSNYATVANLNLRANIADLTTANVSESTSNLYYTNTRVYGNVIALLPTYSGNVAAGNITTGSGAGGSITGANLISTNVISATTWIGISTANVIEIGSNIYYTNTRVYSNVIGILSNYATVANLNLRANIVDLTTANVTEVNNQYYTNARVYSNVIQVLINYATVANLNLRANIVDLTTANVTEFNNLYYTNARVYSNVSGLLSNYATVANLNLKANLTQLTTANVTEVNNLYYTNARVAANVTVLLPTYSGNVGAANVNVGTGVGGAIIGANLISANNFVADTITANTFTLSYRPAFRVWGSTTANVIAGTTLDSGNVTLDYNQNSSYATATGIFTAPITGLYQIYLNGRIGASNATSVVQILKNNVTTAGNVLCYWESATNNQGGQTFGVSTVARLTANDNVRAKVLVGSIKFDANASWGVAFIG
jgi:hypothetical protein